MLRAIRKRPILASLAVSLGLFSGMSAIGAEGQDTMTDAERAARTQELKRQKAAVQQELRQRQARPEGTARSTIPRSEMESQPTRSPKESLEAVPGVAVRQGGNNRSQDLSIRGIAP